MKYKILRLEKLIRVEVTLSNYHQPNKSIQELNRAGIFKEIADTSKVYELLTKDGYFPGNGSGPKLSNFSNGFNRIGIYEFENLDPSLPKPARKSAPREKDKNLAVKNNEPLEKEAPPSTPEVIVASKPEQPNIDSTSVPSPQKKKQSKSMKRRSNN